MFKIGDFAKLSSVSIKALHYYDEVGALKPVYVDCSTGYRYYTFEQLPRLHRILALKDLGFSLEQIKRLLDDALTVEQLRGMLKLRLSGLQEHIVTTQEQLQRAETRLRILEEEGKMSEHEVILKSIEKLKIASAREVVPTPEQMRERCIALMDDILVVLAQYAVKDTLLSLALYHNNSSEGIDVEMAVVLPPSSALPAETGHVKVYELSAVATMASTLYQGSYDDFAAVAGVYAAMGKWIEANSYAITGPSRELYFRAPQLGSGDTSGVMEIQFPVATQKES